MPLSSSQQCRLLHQFHTLQELIATIDTATQHKEINPGKWSIWQNAVHLVTYQHVFLKRMKQVVAEEDPLFERYVGDADPLFLEYTHFSYDELLGDGYDTRKKIIDFLLNPTGTDLKKTGRHLRYGKLTIEGWTESFLLHEAHHLFTIFMLRSQNNFINVS